MRFLQRAQVTECPRHLIPVTFHILLVVVRCPDNPCNVTSHTRFLCYANYHAILFCLQSYEKSRAKQKNSSFFCRDRVSSPSLMAKLRKVRAKQKNSSFFQKTNKIYSCARVKRKPTCRLGLRGCCLKYVSTLLLLSMYQRAPASP